MGCSLSAASDMQEIRHELDREARENNFIRNYYILIHSLNDEISDLYIEKKDVERSVVSLFFGKMEEDDSFYRKVDMYRKDALLVMEDIQMRKEKQNEHIAKILSLTKVNSASESDINDVAKSKHYAH